MALCLVLFFYQVNADDLLKIYDMALQSDPKILQAEANRNAAQELKPQSIARLLPNLAIVGNLTQNRFDTTSTFTTLQVGQQHFWDSNVYLKLTQPLYHHDYWTQLSQSDNQLAQAEADYEAEQQDLFVRTAKAYFAVLTAQDNLDFANAERRAIERQLAQADRKFAVGTVAITDLREAQAGFDLAIANTIASQRALSVAKAALREIIGQDDTELLPMNLEPPLLEPSPPKLEDWSELAQRNNLVIIGAENRAEFAKKNIEVQFAGHLPTLDLVASVGINDTDRPAGLVANSQTVGLQMNMPLFQGGAVNSRVRQSQHQLDAAKQELIKSRRSVEKQIQDAFYGVQFSINQLRALKAAIESTRTAVEATESGFRVGTRTMVDVVTSERNFYRAQRDHAVARYEYITNSLALKQSASILTRQDIMLVNAWLGPQK